MELHFHKLVTEKWAEELTEEFNEYVASHELSDNEVRALGAWVEEGHGVNTSPLAMWVGPEADGPFIEYMREMYRVKALCEAEECYYEDELLCQWDPWLDDFVYIR